MDSPKMDLSQAIEKILPAFEQYYSVQKDAEPPFFATAEFRSHSEQYFLVKSARIADIDSNEHVFFAAQDVLSESSFSALAQAAWQAGLSKVTPYYGHKNSDVALILFTSQMENGVEKIIKNTNFYKSYKWTFYGWSRFKCVVVQLPQGKFACNRHGTDLKKIIVNNLEKITCEEVSSR